MQVWKRVKMVISTINECGEEIQADVYPLTEDKEDEADA